MKHPFKSLLRATCRSFFKLLLLVFCTTFDICSSVSSYLALKEKSKDVLKKLHIFITQIPSVLCPGSVVH